MLLLEWWMQCDNHHVTSCRVWHRWLRNSSTGTCCVNTINGVQEIWACSWIGYTSVHGTTTEIREIYSKSLLHCIQYTMSQFTFSDYQYFSGQTRIGLIYTTFSWFRLISTYQSHVSCFDGEMAQVYQFPMFSKDPNGCFCQGSDAFWNHVYGIRYDSCYFGTAHHSAKRAHCHWTL